MAAFTRKFGHIRPEKGRILLRKHREVTRKFGRHVLTDRKVWPSFDGMQMPDYRLKPSAALPTGCVYGLPTSSEGEFPHIVNPEKKRQYTP